MIAYGDARDEWGPDSVLPEALTDLVHLLDKIYDSLAPERTR